MEIKKSTVITKDFEMDYFRFGAGKKNMVIIPGISIKPISALADLVADMYKDFSKDYTVYVFDRKSELTPADGTVSCMACELVAALKELGIEKAYFIGFSQGGMILQYIAANYPELVKKAIIAGSLARQNATSKAVFDKWYSLAQGDDSTALTRAFFKDVYSEKYYEKYKSELEAPENDGTKEEMKKFAVLADSCRKFDMYGELSEIKCPVLVIGTEDDRVMAEISSKEIAEKLGCELYMYKGYGHAVCDEAPDFTDRVAEFFGR